MQWVRATRDVQDKSTRAKPYSRHESRKKDLDLVLHYPPKGGVVVFHDAQSAPTCTRHFTQELMRQREVERSTSS